MFENVIKGYITSIAGFAGMALPFFMASEL